MSVIKGAFTVSFFIFISRIFGFLRDVLIAQFLGVSYLSDAFFAAFRLPNFFRRVFGEGALNSAFVPIFIENINNNNKKQEKIFAQNIFSILFYILLIFTLIFQIFMPFMMKIIFPGFVQNPEKFDLLVSLSRITIFYLIFISLVSLCSAILNSLSKFSAPAATPIILNVTLIFSIFVFQDITPNYAYALSWGVFLAGILQFIFLLFFTFKAKIILYPKSFSLKLFSEKSVKKFFKKILPGVIGANVMQINLLIDSIFASMVFGAISYLYYADRVNQLPLAMIGIAIGIALLPAMSKKIKEKNDNEAIKLQNLALEISLILVLPAALALNSLSSLIISVLFERGEFLANETMAVSKALSYYSIGLPAYVLVKIFEPAFFARGNTKTPMKIAFICMFANVLFNSIFFFNNFGYIGIVLSSVCSSYLNLILMVIILFSKKLFYIQQGFLTKFIKILLPSLIMFLFLYYFQLYSIFDNEYSRVFRLIFLIIFGGLIYFVSSYFSGSLNILIKAKIFKK